MKTQTQLLCWGDQDFDYEGVDSDERSGGLVLIWNINCFQKKEVIKSNQFIIIVGTWIGIHGDRILASIYGPHDIGDQKILWRKLISIKRSKPGNWVLFGDFNAVRRMDERFNSIFCPASASAFNKFILDAELRDFSMGGEKFTFMARVGAKLSKLDRFLACADFLNAFPSTARELLDHSPITLISHHIDFGPPPFKLFNSWILKTGFDNTVHMAWESCQTQVSKMGDKKMEEAIR